jgi:hypothetical protein
MRHASGIDRVELIYKLRYSSVYLFRTGRLVTLGVLLGMVVQA